MQNAGSWPASRERKSSLPIERQRSPSQFAEVPLQEAKDSLDLLAAHSRQLTRWQEDAITDAERVEVVRLRAIIPEIRPLVQRFIALATELDKRAKTGAVSPRKKWRH